MGHADTLLAMGGAFAGAALLARLGGRIGLLDMDSAATRVVVLRPVRHPWQHPSSGPYARYA
ncbi:hypothetical protein [Streptomyces sp. NPDC004629]|uniref:hypothetical protein n=1 Tax=Streptomyces sp. NPDC004629 TaxID=3364705 RepID=UPI00368BA8B7